MRYLISILVLGMLFGIGCDDELPTESGADTQSPVVSITEPADGTVVRGAAVVTIKASATDNERVTKVEFYINGSLYDTDDTSPFEIVWTTNKLTPSGAYPVYARAYDPSDNIGQSAQITINYSNVK